MPAFIDRTYQTFSRLHIVERDCLKAKRGQVWWHCICECGNEVSVASNDLVSENTKSCGCLARENGKCSGLSRKVWKDFGSLHGQVWARLLRSAASRKRKVTVTFEGLFNKLEKQLSRCTYSGLPLDGSVKDGSASVDRRDSSKDYSEDNVQWVHKDINMMKRDLSEEQFKLRCRQVSTHCRTETPEEFYKNELCQKI